MARFGRAALLAAAAFGLAGVSTASAATLTPDHYYELSGNFKDTMNPGNAALNLVPTAGGTSAFQDDGYRFDDNRGLKLTSGAFTNVGGYTIVVDFRFDDVSSYQKVLDFKNKSTDAGLYVRNGDLNFVGPNVEANQANDAFPANTLKRLVFTRDAATKSFKGYVDGVLQISGTDSGDAGTISDGLSNTADSLLFFEDNSSAAEAEPGFVERIAIFNTVLSTADVQGLKTSAVPVPEPASGVLAVAAAAGLLLRRRRNA